LSCGRIRILRRLVVNGIVAWRINKLVGSPPVAAVPDPPHPEQDGRPHHEGNCDVGHGSGSHGVAGLPDDIRAVTGLEGQGEREDPRSSCFDRDLEQRGS
jgi:hypothetical protein